MNLLLVEDNPGDARPLRELLRDSGLEASTLFTANTLKGATDLLSEDPVDVVLLDLSLPDRPASIRCWEC